MQFIKRVLRNLAIMLAMLPVGLAMCTGAAWLLDGLPEDMSKVVVLVGTLVIYLILAIAAAALQEEAGRINKK